MPSIYNPKSINQKLKSIENRILPGTCRTRPVLMFLDVTSRCNIECIMCWREFSYPNSFGDMTMETFQKVLPLMNYAHTVIMQGSGEPFVNPRFPEMLELASHRTDGISFATNGTIMPEKYAELLVKCRVRKVMVSLDAGKSETYLKIRRKSQWDHVMENLERLVAAKERNHSLLPEISFEFVLMRSNVEDLNDFVKIAHRFGVKYVGIRHLWIFGEATRKESMFLYPDLMKEKFTEAEQLGKELGVFVDLPPQTPIKIAEDYTIRELNDPVLNKLAESTISSPGTGKVCYEPWNNYWITWNGNVFPCCQTNRIMGNVNDSDFEDLWNNLAYRTFRKKIHSGDYPKECIGCRNLRDPQ